MFKAMKLEKGRGKIWTQIFYIQGNSKDGFRHLSVPSWFSHMLLGQQTYFS